MSTDMFYILNGAFKDKGSTEIKPHLHFIIPEMICVVKAHTLLLTQMSNSFPQLLSTTAHSKITTSAFPFTHTHSMPSEP